MDAETASPVFQEVIRPFSAHVAALNADRAKAPISKCTPLFNPTRPNPGRVADTTSYSDSMIRQPDQAARQQQEALSVGLTRPQDSRGAAAASGQPVEPGSMSEAEAAASTEPSAMDEDLAHLQQQLPQQGLPPAPPAPASADAMLPSGGPSRAHTAAAGIQIRASGEQLLRHPARNSLRQGISRELHAAMIPGQRDLEASRLVSCMFDSVTVSRIDM